MTFRVSNRILSKLEEIERDKDKLEALLWQQTGGVCFLCEDTISKASEDYEADHDAAEADGGPTNVENLNLAHITCNRMKKAAGSRYIRPYIKFSRFISKTSGRIKYDGVLDFFQIVPKPSQVQILDETAEFEFPDGSHRSVAIMRECNDAGEFMFVYVDVPRSSLYNDEDCQPRILKREHVGAIFSDLRRNPLHEPPSTRLSEPQSDGLRRLLMFDGQHKTVANWLKDRQRIVAKIYLNLSPEAAIELVNSIQAKIKKLPLSPFELASKLSEEWEDKLAKYELSVGEHEASEAGFISWLPADDRVRAKQAFRAALVQRLLGNPDLRLPQYAKGLRGGGVELTETVIRSKVLERLIFTEPLSEKGEALSSIRDSEASNIVRLLNHLTDAAFEPQGDGQMSEVETERAKRISYQASIAYCAKLLKDLWGNVAMKGSNEKFVLADDLTDDQWTRITQGIDRLVAHPAWNAEYSVESMKSLKLSWDKNQNAQRAFEGVSLDLPYLLIGNSSPAFIRNWAGDVAE
ncbi:HNH endonuclease [Arthrobacter sp. AK01]|uniref:HNH endonuclease signature motif containing protein n=1 Tax=Arthrobacter sp. AK01 TaxID=2894084 RepID=UPI001E4B4DEB|nr:HNH endonuclease signature motif containing protein [Arthrobacter sp. AK01]MCD4852405.1 HNH endonuclease [Arthrobacter sp. AK01]